MIKRNILYNQKGVLAFDFLVGFMLISSFFIMLAILSFTLSAVESIQYVAFATSRSYYAADVTKSDQETNAREKYTQLLENTPAFQRVLQDRWFELPDDPFIGSPPEHPDKYEGVQIDFTAKVLAFELPFFLGITGDESYFKSSVNSYIGREISMDECQRNIEFDRPQAILNLDPNYQIGEYGDGMNQAYVYMEDNGC